MRIGFSAQRILNIDIEARPLGWYGGDWVHKEVTVIACAWHDDPEGSLEVYHITKTDRSPITMYKAFLKRYDAADMIVGHFIRGYDLPVLNAGLAEFDLPRLSDTLTHDTKLDLLRVSGISKSQENLASWLGLEVPKVNMTMEDWRRANRLTPKGLNLAIERAGGDVLQNIAMHRALMDRHLLGKPRMWRPGTAVSQRYHA